MSGAIILENGDLKVEVWPLGARLNGVWFQGIGNLVDGSGTRDEALEGKKYNGTVVGPVANRIAGGTAEIDGRACAFAKNERESTTLHSGPSGVHARDWKVEYQDDTHLILSLALEDGDGGFPGNRTLIVDYRVIASKLRVLFEAGTDAPTWVNMALHPYWTLGLHGRLGQRLSVNADRYLPVDDLQIPTGEIADVTGTVFDLREIGLPSTEIDHNLCLNGGSAPAVVVEGNAGIRMEITTDAPGVQVYTGKEIGIAIEPQHWPDTMHHAHFPSIELRPGERYSQESTYQFSRI